VRRKSILLILIFLLALIAVLASYLPYSYLIPIAVGIMLLLFMIIILIIIRGKKQRLILYDKKRQTDLFSKAIFYN
jgi:membrane protein YdbS with pleckstrin-like domain